jgi:hypothetical protein
MRKIFNHSFILGVGLGLSVLTAQVHAGSCDGNEPCEQGPPPPVLEQQGAPEALEGFFSDRKRLREQRRERRRQQRRIEIYSQPDEGDYFVQSDQGGGDLIGPTEALTQALAAVPGGKALGVKLLKGPNPVYAVKLRVRGKVRRILVDARTAAIVGE